MWYYIAENPALTIITGLFVCAVLGVLYASTRKPVLLIAAILAAAVTVVLCVVEANLETDREQIQRKVHQLARAVANDDLPGVLKHLTGAAHTYASAELPQYDFRMCRVVGFRSVEFNMESQPPRAVVELAALADVNAMRSSYQYDGLVHRGVILTFERQPDGQWLVSNYDHFDPRSPRDRPTY